jgi:hypothetical protein
MLLSQRRRTNNWQGAQGNHITLILGVSHVTGLYQMGGDLAKRKSEFFMISLCRDSYFVLFFFYVDIG